MINVGDTFDSKNVVYLNTIMSKENNYDYTAKERKKREREKMRKLGFKRKELYAHDDDWEDIRAYAEEKMKARLDTDNTCEAIKRNTVVKLFRTKAEIEAGKTEDQLQQEKINELQSSLSYIDKFKVMISESGFFENIKGQLFAGLIVFIAYGLLLLMILSNHR